MPRSFLPLAGAVLIAMTASANAADYVTLPSGLKYKDEVVGTGPEPKATKVTVQYTGWLDENGQKGKEFDSSRDRNQPFTFTIGAGQVIQGWDVGVATMKTRRQAHPRDPGRTRLRFARGRRPDPARRHADLRRRAARRRVSAGSERTRSRRAHMLFAHLADDLFRPLASPSRAFNAALLLHLHRRVMGASVEPIRKGELLAAIGDFAAGWTLGQIADDEAIPVDPVERRSALYRALHRIRLARRAARALRAGGRFRPGGRASSSEESSRIERGETRSYGRRRPRRAGEPGERRRQSGRALGSARERRQGGATFLGHVRSLAGSMRKIEERILREDDLRAAFRLYFEDFVERHLISDYRTLHTRFNPFRFRSAIVREAGQALRRFPADPRPRRFPSARGPGPGPRRRRAGGAPRPRRDPGGLRGPRPAS